MGKCGCFFSARQLVSAGKSHSSGVRGLVRCLLFIPEGSCSNQCLCGNFLQASRSRSVSKEVFSSLQSVTFEFLIFCNRMDGKKIANGPPFTVFGIVRFFKMNIFRLAIRFSQAHALYPIFVFFYRPAFFYATFF